MNKAVVIIKIHKGCKELSLEREFIVGLDIRALRHDVVPLIEIAYLFIWIKLVFSPDPSI